MEVEVVRGSHLYLRPSITPLAAMEAPFEQLHVPPNCVLVFVACLVRHVPESTHEVAVTFYEVLICCGDPPNLVLASAGPWSGASEDPMRARYHAARVHSFPSENRRGDICASDVPCSLSPRVGVRIPCLAMLIRCAPRPTSRSRGAVHIRSALTAQCASDSLFGQCTSDVHFVVRRPQPFTRGTPHIAFALPVSALSEFPD